MCWAPIPAQQLNRKSDSKDYTFNLNCQERVLVESRGGAAALLVVGSGSCGDSVGRCECERLWECVGIFHFGCVEDVRGMYAFKLVSALPSCSPFLGAALPEEQYPNSHQVQSLALLVADSARLGT